MTNAIGNKTLLFHAKMLQGPNQEKWENGLGAEKDTGISKGSTIEAGCCAELKLIQLPLVNYIFRAFTRPLGHQDPTGWKATS